MEQPMTVISNGETGSVRIAIHHSFSPDSSNENIGGTVGIAASFAAEQLSPFLEYWNRELDLGITYSFSPYNQMFQQMLDGESDFSKSRIARFALVRPEDFIRDSLNHSLNEKLDFLRRGADEFLKAVRYQQNIASGPLIIICVNDATHPARKTPRLESSIQKVQLEIRNLQQELKKVFVFDTDQIKAIYRVESAFDRFSDDMGHIPLTDELAGSVATFFTRQLSAILTPRKKIIFIDCDNTLWTGICGEEKIADLIIDDNRKFIQQFLVRKHEEGFLLCLLSKNNEEDAWAVFDTHKDMVLRREHLCGWKINWEHKHSNLVNMLERLKLGIDSAVFLDDSHFEISAMQANCPQVLSLRLPDSPEEVTSLFNHLWPLDKLNVTREDSNRTTYYAAENSRMLEKEKFCELTDFIQSLQIFVSLQQIQATDYERIVQLAFRTNQFNLNGLLLDEFELASKLHQPDVVCWSIAIRDRFGDYGTVGFLMAHKNSDVLAIQYFYLSCRVLGRNVEEMILQDLRKYCKDNNLTEIAARYIETAKNKPFTDFLRRTHWRFCDGELSYRITV
jgi:FkbH-like protein